MGRRESDLRRHERSRYRGKEANAEGLYTPVECRRVEHEEFRKRSRGIRMKERTALTGLRL
jgi:hypothetical protein